MNIKNFYQIIIEMLPSFDNNKTKIGLIQLKLRRRLKVRKRTKNQAQMPIAKSQIIYTNNFFNPPYVSNALNRN